MSNFTIIGFVLTTLITLWLLAKAAKNLQLLWGILIWMLLVSVLGLSGFYQNVDAFPPRFIFLIGPGLIFIALIFLTHRGRMFSEGLDLKWLTLLHCIRVPVELVLYAIFLEGLIPIDMTFEGSNLDILSGLSAPIVYYLVFIKQWIGNKGLLVWNVLCLGLLINILVIAILSAPTPFQQLAFDQPNIGVTYFPFVWLPAIIVPIVLLAHLASLRQLLFLKQ